MQHLVKYFKKNPVIPGITDMKHLDKAMNTNAVAVFLLTGSIFELQEAMKKANEHDKLLFINVDLVKGIGKDREGIKFLAENGMCDGIISTKSNIILAGKEANLITIQRVFMLDTSSLKTAMNMLERTNPDALEILPGIAAPYIIDRVENIKIPIIAGGLVFKEEEITKLLNCGILATSTSKQSLWR